MQNWNWRQSWGHQMMDYLKMQYYLSQILKWKYLRSHFQYSTMMLMKSWMMWKRRSCLKMTQLMRNLLMRHYQQWQSLNIRRWLRLSYQTNPKKQIHSCCLRSNYQLPRMKQKNLSYFLMLTHCWLMMQRTKQLQLMINSDLMQSSCYYYQISPSSNQNSIQLMPSQKNFHSIQRMRLENLTKMKSLKCLKNRQLMTRKTKMRMMRMRKMRMRTMRTMRMMRMMKNYSKIKLMNWMKFQLHSKNQNCPCQMRMSFQSLMMKRFPSLKKKSQHLKQRSFLRWTNWLRQMRHRWMSSPYQMSSVCNRQLQIPCFDSQ